MPRYKFQCIECEHVGVYFLSISETLDMCPICKCSNSMIRLYDKFFSKIEKNKNTKVGNITNEYIEKNREILEKQKKEAKAENYEPS